ncbi:MAG: hypothetical protein UU08_C0007G0020 [Candidatus Uhrbacteria bacterium GW2011_GWE2_40_58]|nr:MAG: hypothetical protein UT94_C0015G0020 [Candidatus Uhrbacteria bacterium GW2011_GWF2_40_263]KKR67866.1 MAG: hypothetical protein UU08_C0007G0020 [Candidatus Uhrbacteria bacterium GW2011_GWE2_40_58]OGL92574.1 MAG: hypothetical protein A2239_04800 [Candidatus Uhrbacteria bacterium RIFOXYA2_FULL_40_9]OGL96838.1 MAG: hypothetical protein A2332_02265 [Candidatus Uhrbacteria bacterium RIFOXYB2_FULL_41_18]HBK34904.1 hypothetical protein [Candidatus Uhrbacteria bacterium]
MSETSKGPGVDEISLKHPEGQPTEKIPKELQLIMEVATELALKQEDAAAIYQLLVNEAADAGVDEVAMAKFESQFKQIQEKIQEKATALAQELQRIEDKGAALLIEFESLKQTIEALRATKLPSVEPIVEGKEKRLAEIDQENEALSQAQFEKGMKERVAKKVQAKIERVSGRLIERREQLAMNRQDVELIRHMGISADVFVELVDAQELERVVDDCFTDLPTYVETLSEKERSKWRQTERDLPTSEQVQTSTETVKGLTNLSQEERDRVLAAIQEQDTAEKEQVKLARQKAFIRDRKIFDLLASPERLQDPNAAKRVIEAVVDHVDPANCPPEIFAYLPDRVVEGLVAKIGEDQLLDNKWDKTFLFARPQLWEARKKYLEKKREEVSRVLEKKPTEEEEKELDRYRYQSGKGDNPWIQADRFLKSLTHHIGRRLYAGQEERRDIDQNIGQLIVQFEERRSSTKEKTALLHQYRDAVVAYKQFKVAEEQQQKILDEHNWFDIQGRLENFRKMKQATEHDLEQLEKDIEQLETVLDDPKTKKVLEILQESSRAVHLHLHQKLELITGELKIGYVIRHSASENQYYDYDAGCVLSHEVSPSYALSQTERIILENLSYTVVFLKDRKVFLESQRELDQMYKTFEREMQQSAQEKAEEIQRETEEFAKGASKEFFELYDVYQQFLKDAGNVQKFLGMGKGTVTVRTFSEAGEIRPPAKMTPADAKAEERRMKDILVRRKETMLGDIRNFYLKQVEDSKKAAKEKFTEKQKEIQRRMQIVPRPKLTDQRSESFIDPTRQRRETSGYMSARSWEEDRYIDTYYPLENLINRNASRYLSEKDQEKLKQAEDALRW